MIPRNLPRLAKDATEHGWNLAITHGDTTVWATFQRGPDTVQARWGGPDMWITETTINDTPTPYRQCVALIRSDR